MLHRWAKVKPGQRVLVHDASGGVGTAFLQLGQLAGVEMYGTCSTKAAQVVRKLGATPVDHRNSDFVEEIHRLTGTVSMPCSTASAERIYGARAVKSC